MICGTKCVGLGIISRYPLHDMHEEKLSPEVKVSRNGPERRSGKRIIAGTAFRLEFQVR